MTTRTLLGQASRTVASHLLEDYTSAGIIIALMPGCALQGPNGNHAALNLESSEPTETADQVHG